VIDGELISLNPSVNGHIVTDTILNAVVSILGMNQLDSYRMQAEADYPLRYQAFDVLQFQGDSVMGKPLVERKKMLHEILVKLWESADSKGLPQLKWIEEVPCLVGSYGDKLEFYKQVTGNGGEGLVVKDVNSFYNPHENRGGMSAPWVKYKRTVSESIGADVDAFIDGTFEPGSGKYEGMVGSIGFSVYLFPSGKQHRIAMVSGLPDSLRKSLSDKDDNGNLRVKPGFVGIVGVLDGQDFGSRSGTMLHARLNRLRTGADAKLPQECVFQETQLNELVL
jgi:ATP-dependent DNA ligase